MNYNRYIYILLFCLALGACSTEEGIPVPDPEQEMISFSPNVRNTEETRAYTGTIDNLDALKNDVGDGFGVFGYLTEGDLWSTAKGSYAVNDDDYPTPDFMFNQSVYWGLTNVDTSTDPATEYKGWTYTPPKYWPNTTNNATARYISFFAYAPWTAEGESVGVTGFPDASDKSPHVTYTVGAVDQQTDLLYANCVNATRNGKGLIVAGTPPTANTYEKVPLTFHHALSRIDVYVQRLYDEETFTGKVPVGTDYTRLFISKLEMAAESTIYKEGDLNLETGAWTGTTAYTGNKYTFTESDFSEIIRGTATDDAAVIQDYELDKWKRNFGIRGFGVDETERPLFAYSRSLMLIPDGELTLTPTVTYSMVTRDNELQLNYLTDSDGNRYQRIVNTVKGDPVKITLNAGKRYKLLIHIGVESVQFEVVSVEDWDFPIRLDPTVEDPTPQTLEKTVNEG